MTVCTVLYRAGFGVTLNRDGLHRPYPRTEEQVNYKHNYVMIVYTDIMMKMYMKMYM